VRFEFCSKCIDRNTFRAVYLQALKMVSLSGITYLMKQRFSRMVNVKSEPITRITNTHSGTHCELLPVRITLWPWSWTFTVQHTIYVKCEYFMNPEG
jgi:hypothetical protein